VHGNLSFYKTIIKNMVGDSYQNLEMWSIKILIKDECCGTSKDNSSACIQRQILVYIYMLFVHLFRQNTGI